MNLRICQVDKVKWITFEKLLLTFDVIKFEKDFIEMKLNNPTLNYMKWLPVKRVTITGVAVVVTLIY